MYAVDYVAVYRGQPREDAVIERAHGRFPTAKAAWAEVFSYATSNLRMVTASIDNIDFGCVVGTPDELRRKRGALLQRLRPLERWTRFAKARC